MKKLLLFIALSAPSLCKALDACTYLKQICLQGAVHNVQINKDYEAYGKAISGCMQNHENCLIAKGAKPQQFDKTGKMACSTGQLFGSNYPAGVWAQQDNPDKPRGSFLSAISNNGFSIVYNGWTTTGYNMGAFAGNSQIGNPGNLCLEYDPGVNQLVPEGTSGHWSADEVNYPR